MCPPISKNLVLLIVIWSLRNLVADLKRCQIHLLYNNLRPDGVLAKAARELNIFPDFECMDAFLKLINYTDGCEPLEGLYENLVCYLAVGVTQRREYQENLTLMPPKLDQVPGSTT